MQGFRIDHDDSAFSIDVGYEFFYGRNIEFATVLRLDHPSVDLVVTFQPEEAPEDSAGGIENLKRGKFEFAERVIIERWERFGRSDHHGIGEAGGEVPRRNLGRNVQAPNPLFCDHAELFYGDRPSIEEEVFSRGSQDFLRPIREQVQDDLALHAPRTADTGEMNERAFPIASVRIGARPVRISR